MSGPVAIEVAARLIIYGEAIFFFSKDTHGLTEPDSALREVIRETGFDDLAFSLNSSSL